MDFRQIKITWPIALMFIVLVAGITIYNINKSNHNDIVRVACLQQHGLLGEERGVTTCTYPK